MLEGVTPDEVMETRALVSGLELFRAHVRAVVADFPRAVAWPVCANVFGPQQLVAPKETFASTVEKSAE